MSDARHELLLTEFGKLLHDLNNRIGVALGSVEVLLGAEHDSASSADVQRALQALEAMRDTIERGARLLRGQRELAEVDVGQLAAELLPSIEQIAVATGRTIDLDLPAGLRVWAVRDALADLLLALLLRGSGHLVVTGVQTAQWVELQLVGDVEAAGPDLESRLQAASARLERAPQGATVLLDPV